MKVAAIKVKNILGITEAEIKPGNVTLIEGANGVGKSSILEAFRAVLEGGHDATLLRQGEERGEIVLVLDDGQEIAKEITAEKSTLTVRHPEFGKLARPRTVIDKICDAFALNPVEFLTAKRDARLQLLLAAIPMKVSRMDLAEILPLCSVRVDCDQHALQVLGQIQKDLYDQRTGVNRSVKDKKSTIAELQKALPAEAGDGDWQVVLRDAKAAWSNYVNEADGKARRINQQMQTAHQQARDAASAEIQALQMERDNKLEQIRAEYQQKMDSRRDQLARDIERFTGAASVSHEMLAEERRPKEQELTKAVAEAEAALQTFSRAQAARDHIQTMSSGLADLETEANSLSAALTELDTIKSDLLDRLPIKGVELHDGEIFVDGIPFDRLNESRRVRLAIDVAMLRAGGLPLICVDGIEALDRKSIQALEDVAIEKNVQLVLARVTDGALDVKVIA